MILIKNKSSKSSEPLKYKRSALKSEVQLIWVVYLHERGKEIINPHMT